MNQHRRIVTDAGDAAVPRVRAPRRWRRPLLGAGLAMLGGAAVLVGAGPASQALAGDAAPAPGPQFAAELAAAGVGDASHGRMTGRRMAPSDAFVTPLLQAPVRPYRELVATIGSGGSLEKALRRAGVPRGDAASAAAAVAAANRGRAIEEGTKVNIRLGAPGANDVRPLEQVTLRAAMDLQVALNRTADGFTVARETIAVTREPLRIRGRAGDGLYWSLRAAGVTPRAAQEYLRTLSKRIDVGDVGPDAMFDLVIEHRRTADGDHVAGPLLYAGIDRRSAGDVAMLRWTVGGREQWLDALSLEGRSEGLIWPVSARISSNFGMRRHPILRYKRMHNGIDFAAGYGTPIRAAADGVVNRAGWAGGYGKQVRLSHDDGLQTSYSHMSSIAVGGGARVRQGQVIGYVGSTGLSTGAHLHYEVRRGGAAIDPRGVRMVRRPVLEGQALAAFKARYEGYKKLPVSVPEV